MNENSHNIDQRALSIVVTGLILTAFLCAPLTNGNSHLKQQINNAQKASASINTVRSEDLEELRNRELLFPLKGFTSIGIKDTFSESRGNHRHEAIDIVAPRNTPVVAVDDGKIARLWYSQYGGITIYEFDPTSTYAYYYAHLEKYADNLKEQDWVEKGQVIGYVGTSGNAPKETPHLHFTIFKLTEEKHWWQGSAINPYDIYMHPPAMENSM